MSSSPSPSVPVHLTASISACGVSLIRTLAVSVVLIPGFLLGSAARSSAEDAGYRKAMAEAVRAAATRVLPSVVTIEIVGAAGVEKSEVEQDAPTSGLVVDPDGFILGSSIVIRRPSASILVVLPDGTRHAAKVISRDQHRDLVLLKIETEKPLTAAEFPPQLETQIGQTTIAVGRYGTDASPIVSSGVLSATERLDGIALQTDARVSPAFYGGPLIDLRGRVLGVLIPAVAEGGAPDATSWYDSGIAFAVPADVVARKLGRLTAGEDIKKGLIGIVSKSKDPYENQTEIAAVRTRSPAEAAGIKAGDQVLSVDGTPVRRHQEIKQVLGRFDAGELVRISLQRDGTTIDVEVTLAESIPPLQPQRLGLIASQQTRDDDQSAVVVDDVIPDSPAEKSLRAGDVILQVDGTEISEIEPLRRRLVTADPDVALKVTFEREGKEDSAEIVPSSISGPLLRDIPPTWIEPNFEDWPIEALKLPDVGNAAAYAAPKAEDDFTQLGLLILLLNPGQGAPDVVLKDWASVAQTQGVVVCAIAPENNGRWKPKEMEVIGRFAAAVLKRAPIEPTAVAVAAAGALTGKKAEAADSMALAVAVSQSSTFFGAAVSPESRTPAIRLRENDASASLQLLLAVKESDDLPTWAAPLERVGYPVVRGGEVDRKSLLRWVRLLQAI